VAPRRPWRRQPPPTDEPNAPGSPLEGYVEYPVDGGEVERRLVVAGWHAWHAAPVSAVVVDVDGIVRRAQASDVARVDVAADHGDDGFLHAGWVADVDLGAVRTPTVTVRVTVYPSRDHRAVELDPITVAVAGDPTIDEEGRAIPPPNEVVGRLDVPGPGARVRRGAVEVRGWATSRDAPASHVELSIGDVVLGRARLGLDRGDVAAERGWASAPVCGFEQLVDLSAVELADAVGLRATVVALDGSSAVLEHDVGVVPGDGATPEVPPPARRPRPAPGAGLDLFVATHDLGLGGAQLWLVELLRRSGAGRAFPCTVVAFAGGALTEDLGALGIDVHVSSPLPVGDVQAYEGRLEELATWTSRRAHTAALVNTFRAFPGADLAVRAGLPLVWAIHESWPATLIWEFDHPGARVDPAVRSYADGALAAAGAVIFEADATRALYEARAPGRTLVVPYGVDTAELDRFAAATSRRDARAALGLDEAGRILLVMGTVEPRKGQALLVEAFAELAGRHADVSIALVGDLDTPYSRAIGEFAERAGLSARVRRVAVTDEANLWYRACDALVCGSDVESLPRSVLDAMCFGLPVLATNVFGLGELLDDGETGLLFEPLDLAAAIGGLDRLLSMDAAQLARIAERASALVHERHDSSGYANDVVALLRGLLADPGALPSAILADPQSARV
jgi:D-inositol-3-phosphate glycosyltransferase